MPGHLFEGHPVGEGTTRKGAATPVHPDKNTGVGCHFLLQCMKVKRESEVAQSCPTLCDPMDCSTPGFPVHHQIPEFTQTHVHRVGDAIQPSHPCRPLYVLPSIFPSFWPFQ